MAKTDGGRDARPTNPPTAADVKAQADWWLGQVDWARKRMAESQLAVAAELQRLIKLSPFWEALKAEQDLNLEREKQVVEDLQKFMEEYKQDLFPLTGVVPESLKTELPGGELFYSAEEYVVKRKAVLANLEKYGFEEAIRRTAATDWDVLADPEEWPDEVLAFLGTERKKRESFTFEVREEP